MRVRDRLAVPFGVPVVPLLYGRIAMASAVGEGKAGGGWPELAISARELTISPSSGPRDRTCRTEATRAAASCAWVG